MAPSKPPREPANGTDALVVTTDESGRASKAAGTDGGETLKHQDALPKLPIPPLEGPHLLPLSVQLGVLISTCTDTCKRYIRALSGLQNPSDHAKTKQVVDDFLKKDGPPLFKTLKDYAATRESYIEEFWDESYLGYEDSVVLSLNPFFILECATNSPLATFGRLT